jgi:hypothetical protein
MTAASAATAATTATTAAATGTDKGAGILTQLRKIYNTTGFFEKYGFHLFIAIVIIFAFSTATAYFVFDLQLGAIRRNWSSERCKPLIMPLAGIINAPEGADKAEYASTNFNYCVSQFFTSVFEKVISGMYYATNIAVGVFTSALESIDAFRVFFNKLREHFLTTIIQALHGIMNFIIPFINVLVKMRDLMKKIEGIFLAIINMLFSAYLALKSLIGSMLTLSIIIIVVMLIILIIMWVLVALFWAVPFLIPFHPPVLVGAITFTLTVILIIVPFCILAAFAGMVFKVNSTVPKVNNQKANEEMAKARQ